MPGIIFLMLPLSVLLMFVLMTMALGDAAFRNVGISPATPTDLSFPSKSRLPTLEIASILQRLTEESSTMLKQVACGGQSFVPLVTDPEARVIADELKQRDGGELKRVLERSRLHSQSCPMLTSTGMCACSTSRPLACIGRCVVGGDSPEWAIGLGETVSEAFRVHLQQHQINADTRRLDDALVSLMDRPRDSAC